MKITQTKISVKAIEDVKMIDYSSFKFNCLIL